MEVMKCIILSAFALSAAALAQAEKVDWVYSLKEAQSLAKKNQKPIFGFLHAKQ